MSISRFFFQFHEKKINNFLNFFSMSKLKMKSFKMSRKKIISKFDEVPNNILAKNAKPYFHPFADWINTLLRFTNPRKIVTFAIFVKWDFQKEVQWNLTCPKAMLLSEIEKSRSRSLKITIATNVSIIQYLFFKCIRF